MLLVSVIVSGVLDSLLSAATSSEESPSSSGESQPVLTSIAQGGVAFSKGVSSETTPQVEDASSEVDKLSDISELRLKGGRKTSSTSTLFYWNGKDDICRHLFSGDKF